MKKIAILILFAFSIGFVNAQKSEEITRLEKLNLKPIESVTDKQGGKMDKETKALRVNRNEHFKSEAKEANAIVLSYLQEKRAVYGLSNNQADIKVVKTTESPAGKYVYCQQYLNNIPVFATNFIIYFNKENIITYTLNEFRNVAKYRDVKDQPSVNVNNALKTANEYLNIMGNAIDNPKTELVYFESIDKGLELAWKINIISTEKPLGSWQIFVSAEAGHIIHVESTRTAANGNGKVFKPNPLVSVNVSYGGNYVHNNGATNSYLDGQLFQVTLNDITYENGLYKLKGPYCTVQDLEYPYGHNIPELANSNFYYTRNQEEFEAVMCYYHVDLSARRIMQLGYTIPNGLKNLRVDPHGARGDRNAYYDWSNYLTFGGGGNYVDAAEDADIIWHEYGHAIQFNFTPVGMSYSGETQSLQEGSSDYWATSYKRQLYPNYWQALCVWFDMNIPVVARRADLNWVYPTNYVWGHNGGQIWSSALMKIWGDLGKNITDQLFLETHLIWGYSPNMRDAAAAFIQADVNLYQGSHLCQIIARFKEHGLIEAVQENITQNTVWNTNRLLVGDIAVNSGATLTITSNVKCFPNTKITVKPGGKLIVNGGTLTNTCDNQMWQGIVVEGNSSLNQNATNQGTVELTNGAMIENAITGISTCQSPKSGGRIIATNAIFKNNGTAVKIYPYIYSSNGTISSYSGNFTRCQFIGNYLLTANGQSFSEHVWLSGIKGILFKGCSFSRATFSVIRKAIYALNAGFTIDDDCPLVILGNVVPPSDCSCYIPSIRSSFSGFLTAVSINTTGDQYAPTITRSDFTNNDYSIEINGVNNATITRSTFNGSSTTYYGYAIQLLNATGYKVEENTFSKGAFDTYGIYVHNSGTAENSIYRNKFFNFSYGIDVNAGNGSTNLAQPGLQFGCNEFNSVMTSIYCFSGATIRAQQGAANKGADNDFNTVTTGFYSPSQTFVYYYSNSQANHNPKTSNPPLIPNAGIANSCPSTICSGGFIVIGPPAQSPPANQYDNLLENYSDLQAQYRSVEKKAEKEREASGNISRETADLQKSLAEKISDISLQMNEISQKAIREILEDTISLNLDLLATWYAKIHTLSADYALAETYYEKGDYAQADAALQNILSKHKLNDVQMEEHKNYSRFHALKNELQRSDRYWDALTEKEIDELISIAEASDERSSTMAKGVLCFFYDICYETKINREKEIPDINSKSLISTVTSNPVTFSEIQIFPNPTDGNLTVFIPELPEGAVTFQLFDVLGRNLLTQSLTDNNTVINLSQLARGIYHYQLISNEVILKSDKLVKR